MIFYEDAQEFLGRCLDELSEDITKMKIPRKENLISCCFQHEVLETFTCNQCHQVSSVTNSDVSIWCDISKTSQDNLDLQQLLLNNFSNEIREKRCHNCDFNEATLKRKITLLPPILVIYLKRFRYGLHNSGKIRNCVKFPSLVELSSVVDVEVKLPFTNSRQFNSGNHSYLLQSVVSHKGSTETSGHYIADVCRSDAGKTPVWFRYDDDKVTKTNLESVLTDGNVLDGYIFTYLYKGRIQKKNLTKGNFQLLGLARFCHDTGNVGCNLHIVFRPFGSKKDLRDGKGSQSIKIGGEQQGSMTTFYFFPSVLK